MKYKIIDLIKNRREKEGLQQIELAEIIGITNSALSLYEKHKEFPVYKILAKLLIYFKIEVDHDLFAQRLNEYKEKHRFSTKQMSQLLDLNMPQMFNVLSKRKNYSVKTILKICYDLHFDINELIGIKDNVKTKKDD